MSFFKVINKQWRYAYVKRNEENIQIKAEKSNWFLPTFSETHKRIIRLDHSNLRKNYLIKLQLKDARVTKREKRKYYRKMLRKFPKLYKAIKKNLNMDVTVYAKTYKHMSIKRLKMLFKRKRHYYSLKEIINIISKAPENVYFVEIKIVSNGKEAIFRKGKLIPGLNIYSDTELILSY